MCSRAHRLLLPLAQGVLRMAPTSLTSQVVRQRHMLHRSTRATMVELNSRREKVELNHLLKDGAVPIYKRAAEGLFNQGAELAALQARLGERFEPGLLGEAMVSPSHVAREVAQQRELGVEVEVGLEDHTRLAGEGARVLQVTLEEWLGAALPAFPEEGVRGVVEHLVGEAVLAEVAFYLGLRELVLSSTYPPTREELATSFRALVGALAAGAEDRARQLVVDLVASQLQGKDLNELWEVKDPMGLLVATLEQLGRSQPEARLLWETAPSSILATYRVGVYVDRELVGESPGETLQEAEEMAARDALRNLYRTSEHAAPLPWATLPAQA